MNKKLFIKPFYFQIHTSQNEIQTPKLLLAALYFTGSRLSHLYGHSKIRTGTGHRLGCRIFSASVLAISKNTFP